MDKDQIGRLLKYIDFKFKQLNDPDSYLYKKRLEELAFELKFYAED